MNNKKSKAIVVYESKTGFTKKYAKLISQAIDCPISSRKESEKIDLENFTVVIYGGSLYASGVLGLKKIKKRLKGQKLIVFAVGASGPKDNILKEIKEANFSEREKNDCSVFYLRGGFNFNKLNLMDKGLMLLMKRSIEKKKPSERTADDRGLLNAYDQPVDFTREKNIEPLISYYKAAYLNE